MHDDPHYGSDGNCRCVCSECWNEALGCIDGNCYCQDL
jgi:hypothetical protein